MISVYPQILPYRTPYGLKFQIQFYRTMVGPHYLAVNLRILQILFQGRRGDEIINSPSGILLSCLKSVRPPGVGALKLRIKVTKCINKSSFQSSGKAGSLFICEACVHPVGSSGQFPDVPHSCLHSRSQAFSPEASEDKPENLSPIPCGIPVFEALTGNWAYIR